eukprot:COSAG01_NODE_914_length_12771_cov_47.345802_13_plen_90_part_00
MCSLYPPRCFCVLVTYPPGRRPGGEFLAVQGTATELRAQGAGDSTDLGHGLVPSRPRLVRGRLAQNLQRAPSRCGGGAASRAAADTITA